MSPMEAAPPCFEEARNLRQQVRATGMDPDYWYAVEEVHRIKPGTVVEIIFWKRSIALYRGTDGSFHALDNRCAHRQIKLSLGEVQGCQLVCAYHGWKYDQEGRRVDILHDRNGGKLPKPSIRSYPVKVRYGLVWLFPGIRSVRNIDRFRKSPSSRGPSGGPACHSVLRGLPTTR